MILNNLADKLEEMTTAAGLVLTHNELKCAALACRYVARVVNHRERRVPCTIIPDRPCIWCGGCTHKTRKKKGETPDENQAAPHKEQAVHEMRGSRMRRGPQEQTGTSMHHLQARGSGRVTILDEFTPNIFTDPHAHASALNLTFSEEQAGFICHHIRNAMQTVNEDLSIAPTAVTRLLALAKTVEANIA